MTGYAKALKGGLHNNSQSRVYIINMAVVIMPMPYGLAVLFKEKGSLYGGE